MLMNNRKIDISIVIPIYNEQDNVFLLHESVTRIMRRIHKSYEIIFVDDGSCDNSLNLLREIQQNDGNTRVVKFRRNFGQSAAMAAGFELAIGDNIIAMDGDLQNDPEDIPRLLEKLAEGYDVVSGWRKNRKDKLLIRKIPSKIANKLICSVTKIYLHDTGCSLKAFQKKIIKRINVYGELHRFIPVLAKIEGAKIAEVVVNHHPRKFGQSKYNLTRTFRVLMDLTSLNLFLKYLKNPLQFFSALAFYTFLIPGLTGFWALIDVIKYDFQTTDVNLFLTFIFLLAVTIFQFLFFGFIAVLIVYTGKKKSIYLVDKYAQGKMK